MPASGVIRYGGAEYSFRPESRLWYLELVPRGISNQGRVYQRDPGWPGQAGSFLRYLPAALWRAPCIMEINFISWTKSTFFPKKMALGSSGFPPNPAPGWKCLSCKKNEVRSSFLMNFCRHEQVFGSFNGKLSVPGQKLSLDHISGFTEQFESRL